MRNADELKSNGMIPGTFNIPRKSNTNTKRAEMKHPIVIIISIFQAVAELEDAFKMTDDAFQVKYGFDKASPNLCFSCQAGRRAQAAIEKLKGVLPEKNMK